MRFVHGLLLGGMFIPLSLRAADILSESYLSAQGSGVVVSGAYSYFDDSLDVIGYLDSLEGSSRPQSYEKSSLTLAYQFESWRPFVEYSKVEGDVKRSVQPFTVSSSADYLSLGMTYRSGSPDDGFSSSLSLTQVEQGNVTVDCYERSGVILGGSCSEADFQLIDGDRLIETGESIAAPVLTSSAEALSVELSLDRWWALSDSLFLIGHSLSLKGSQVEHQHNSPLYSLQSPFLLNMPFNGSTLGEVVSTLRDDLPQELPWKEAVVRYDASISYLSDNWVISGSIGALYAKRFSYEDALGRKQYKRNVTATTELRYLFEKGAVILRLDAYSNYLLGVDPLAYTNKSSRFFEHPYGQVSLGFMAFLD